jgi:radical SAM superfamily enzyme YgiQ (UPF0313 family)
LNKFLFVSVPLVETLYPSAAYGALKPVAEKNGLKCELLDLNLRLSQHYSEEIYDEISNWAMILKESATEESIAALHETFERFLKPELPNARWIAISVFSFYSCRPTVELLKWLQKQEHECTILLGGNGASVKLDEYGQTEYGMWVLEQGLANHCIFGEAEVSLDHLLKGDAIYPGIDDPHFEQVKDMNELDYPDYSGVDWQEYHDPRILITGSRGCVRKCTFCDIGVTWPKFAYRSADKLVEEIKQSVYEHGITRFEFTDSLINGSVSNFNKFNEALANARAKDPVLEQVSYMGQFICRSKKVMPESTYELMHYAGCNQITTGIESFSERVRHHMKKKFSDSDIDYHLEACGRWHIPNVFLMIVGYPTETEKDHKAQIRALHRYKDYAKAGVIFMMRWGLTMHIYDGTPIADMSNELGIHSMGGVDNKDAVYNWVSATNPTNTLETRLRRRLEVYETSVELGYAMANSRRELNSLYEIAKEYKHAKRKTIFDGSLAVEAQ